MGRKYFIFLYRLSRNRYRVNTTALINTKVNNFAFINIIYIINIAKFLHIKVILFKKSTKKI